MANPAIALCAHCTTDLPPRRPGQPGPARQYCGARCRKAASRERCRRDPEPLAELAGLELPPLPPPTSADDQLAAVLLDLKGGAGALARLSLTARREFAWRCESAAAAIRRALAEYFPGT